MDFVLVIFGGVVVNSRTIIGKDCNIASGVTFGEAVRGKRQGFPIIGDHVWIGPGAKVFGKINIGDHAAIGANSVVTSDVPDNAVVVGAPGRLISYNGSVGYINRIDY